MSASSSVAISRNGTRSLTTFFGCFLVVLYLPTMLLMVFAFNDSTTQSWPPVGFTTHWFSDAANDSELIKSVVNSLKVGIIVAVAATAIGLAVSYPLARRKFWLRSPVSALMLSPLVVPAVVLGVAMLMMIRKGPVIAIPLTGATTEDLLGLPAVVIGHTVLALPFTILLLMPRIASIDRSLEEAAHDLGASGLVTFRRVMLPLMTPAIISAFLIAFVISIDEVVVAGFVTEDEQTLPMFLYASLRFPAKTALVLPVAFLLIVASFALAILATVIRVRGDRRVSAS
jgi:spermidine/putrescine transport system permease protein